MLFSSCSSTRIPFTSELKKELNLSEEDIKGIQFYVSDNLILFKQNISETNQTNETGKILLNSKNIINQIIIKRRTKGIVTNIVGNDIALVSFEIGNNKDIVFGTKSGQGEYRLMSKEWDKTQAKINYGGQSYWTGNGANSVYLEIKVKSINKLIRKTRVVSGRKINKS